MLQPDIWGKNWGKMFLFHIINTAVIIDSVSQTMMEEKKRKKKS